MPFLWSVVEQNGQLYGNRDLQNKVNNANRYWFSYPGYNEIFTGYPDTAVNSNGYPPNPNTNLLEYINKQKGYENKVAAFGAWDAFDRILNQERGEFPVYSAFDPVGGTDPTTTEKTINALAKDAYKPFGEAEVLDVFTHYGAINYLQTKKSLDPVQGEHLLKLINLFDKGVELFGSIDEFNYWLNKPFWNALEKPMDWLITPGGVDLVALELDRIGYGYPA